MVKLKKIFSIIIVLAFIISFLSSLSAPVSAQKRYGLRTSRPRETTGIFIDDSGNTMDYGVWIYGIKIFADAANSFVGFYDCDTTAELIADTTYPKDEIGEATQYDTAERYYSTPEYYSDGVGAIMATGVAFVMYGPAPE